MKRKYDFAGWATKNDILCSDGAIIEKGAFTSSKSRVPLVWNHDSRSPKNVIGHMDLVHKDAGTFGYGYFNSTENGKHSKEMVKEGDIVALSIAARRVKKNQNRVIHGEIYEVSLVPIGANPGAVITEVLQHSDEEGETIWFQNGLLIHSSEDITTIVDDEPEEEIKLFDDEDDVDDDEDDEDEDWEDNDMGEKELREILGKLSDEELDTIGQAFGLLEENNDINGGQKVKHNIWNGVQQSQTNKKEEILKHMDQEAIIKEAFNSGAKSLMAFIKDKVEDTLEHSGYDESKQVGGVNFGITNIDFLFADANDTSKLKFVHDQNTEFMTIINGVSRSPLSTIKSRYIPVDINEEKERAKGYKKGTRKVEEVIKVLRRKTTPTTIYKKQKLDRDDVIEITDFDIIAALNAEMRTLLLIELARAILVGDGREELSEGKISQENIRPILFDDPVYSIKVQYTDATNFLETVIKNMPEYQGSGAPKMFIDPILLADIKLLKGTDGRWLSGHIPSNIELAMQMDVGEIVPTSFLKGKGVAIVVNLADYKVGSTKGGQLTTFSDFDIDFNRHKMLIETRLSGALEEPATAMVFHKADMASEFKIAAGKTEEGRP